MKLGSRAKPAIPPVGPGTYIGVCVGIVDLGEQEVTYNGKTKYTNKIQFVFELPTEIIEVDGEQQPRWLSRQFTMSSSSRGQLRPFLETWIGRKLSDDAAAEFELFDQLGKAAMLSVVLSEDGQYANIASAIALPAGIPVPAPKSEHFAFDVDAWDDSAFEKLPEYLQERIKNSTQYKAAHLPADEVSVEAAEAAAARAAEAEGGAPF